MSMHKQEVQINELLREVRKLREELDSLAQELERAWAEISRIDDTVWNGGYRL